MLEIEKLEDTKKKLKNKQDSIENLQYEAELIKNDIIEQYKNLHNSDVNLFRGLDTSILKDIWRMYNNKNTKQNKTAYEYVCGIIKKTFFPDKDWELTNILNYNYDLGYIFEYGAFSIQIPCFNEATKENYIYFLEYAVFYRENSVQHCIARGLDYHQVAENFIRWYHLLEKKEKGDA